MVFYSISISNLFAISQFQFNRKANKLRVLTWNSFVGKFQNVFCASQHVFPQMRTTTCIFVDLLRGRSFVHETFKKKLKVNDNVFEENKKCRYFFISYYLKMLHCLLSFHVCFTIFLILALFCPYNSVRTRFE